MTRILLIDPSYKESRYLQQKDVYPHTGLLTIGTVLKQAGHTVKVVHMVADEVTDLPALIKEFKPDIAGVTFVTFQLRMAYAVLAGIKGISKDIITVVGGAHPSATNLIENSKLNILKYVDVVISGEGENAFLDIANNGVKQRFYRGEPCDINQLPELDLSLTDIKRFAGIYPPGPLPSMPMICSRGCPFNCVAEGEKVTLSDGSQKPIEQIRVGDMVLSVNEEGKITNSCVTTSVQTSACCDIISIVTNSNILRCTKDHKIYTPNGWVEAGKLKRGDYVANWSIHDIQRWNTEKKETIASNGEFDGRRENQIPSMYGSALSQETQSSLGRGNSKCDSETYNQQPNVASRDYRKEPTISISKYRSQGASKATDAYQQPDEESENTGKGEQFIITQQGSPIGKYEEDLAGWTFETPYSNRRGAQGEQSTHERKQPNEKPRVESEGNGVIALAGILKPEELCREICPEASRPESYRSKVRRVIKTAWLQICRGWSFLGGALPIRKLSQPRLHLEEWSKQNRTSVQFGLLARHTNGQRCGNDEGLRSIWLEDIYNQRRATNRYGHSSNECEELVGFQQIKAVIPSGKSAVYDIETVPHHNFIASNIVVHNCTFCSKSVFGKHVRFRKPELIVNELKHWADLGVKEVFFQDDTFNCHRKFCEELLERLVSEGLNRRMVFRARLRANRSLVDESLLSELKLANFWLIFYGVESGNQSMLDKMSKGLELAEIKRAFQLTRKAGIKAEGSFIIGMPGETESTIKDSLRFYEEIKPDWCSFNRAIPFPGTVFEQEARKSHHLIYPNYEDYRLNETLVRTEALTAEQLEHWAQVADKVLLRNKVRRLISQPRELFNVVKDAGLKGVMSRMVRLAR